MWLGGPVSLRLPPDEGNAGGSSVPRTSVYKECFICKKALVKQVLCVNSPEGYVPTPCDLCLKQKRPSVTTSSSGKLQTLRALSTERLEDIPEDEGLAFSSNGRRRSSLSPLQTPGQWGPETVVPSLPSPEELGLPIGEGQRYFSFLQKPLDRVIRSPKDIIQEFIRYEEGLRVPRDMRDLEDLTKVTPDLHSNDHAHCTSSSLPAGLDHPAEDADPYATSGRYSPPFGGSAVDLSCNMESTISLLEKHCGMGSPQSSPRSKRHTFAGVTSWTSHPTSLDIPVYKLDCEESAVEEDLVPEKACRTCGDATHVSCGDSQNNLISHNIVNNNNSSTLVPKQTEITIVLPEPRTGDTDDETSSTKSEEMSTYDLSLLNPWQVWQQRRNSRNSDLDDLDRLKVMTSRLQLDTRRESYVTWKENYVEKPYLWRHRIAHEVVNRPLADDWSRERVGRVNEAITWIKRELVDMRSQDQALARRLISLRRDISEYRLEKTVAEAREAIDEAVEQEEEKRDDLAELNDAPPDQFCSILKEFGVTRLNVHSRRFSVF